LDELANDSGATAARSAISSCTALIRSAVTAIHARQPTARLVLVGIFDNNHWPAYFARWQSAVEQANINRGLDRFDDALRALAAADRRLAFFDDRAWFAARWGKRDRNGAPAYRKVRLASGFEISNSVGDSPEHAVVADGHAGLAWNALWAQSLVTLLNERFDAHIAPLTDAEIAFFVQHEVDQKPKPQ
jgi:hypothetical protein